MKFTPSDTILINLIKDAVESKGCRLSDVDIEKLTVKIDGPDDAVSDCARAVAEILD
jgi:hypothetical protein